MLTVTIKWTFFYKTFVKPAPGGNVFLYFFKAKNEEKLKKSNRVKKTNGQFWGQQNYNKLFISNFLCGGCLLK